MLMGDMTQMDHLESFASDLLFTWLHRCAECIVMVDKESTCPKLTIFLKNIWLALNGRITKLSFVNIKSTPFEQFEITL